jgi:hypothetical protein
MGHVKIKDDALWATHIEGDDRLRDRLLKLPSGASVDLEVDGIVGRWVKMKDGKDGRPTPGLRPIDRMQRVWKSFQARRGDIVTIRETRTADSYLEALRGTLSEWNSPEDEEAFRDL